MEEGYIKYNPVWTKKEALPASLIKDLNACRQQLYDLDLIGVYQNGIGYGNISCRYPSNDNHFIISGSTTGNYPVLGPEHYSLVTQVEIHINRLHCQGPIIASSESMSHAVIYQELPWVKAAIHVHNLEIWQRLLHKVPTTDASAPYGTPEMAYSIIDLIRTSNLPEKKIFVMEGHKEGMFAFGKNLAEAMEVVLMAWKDHMIF